MLTNYKQMKTSFKNILIVFSLTTMGGFTGVAIFKAVDKSHYEQTFAGQSGQGQKNGILLASYAAPEATIDFTKAAESSVHAVVHVKTFYEQEPTVVYDPFHNFFGGNQLIQPKPQESSGSGVIISEDGYIVTNNHVVANANKIEVTLNDRNSFIAKVIGTDPATDLALIKIDEKKLPFIPYGNSDELKVGEWVLAVGNPFNLNSTVTAGIVSAKARNINILANPQNNPFAIESFIQTDAAVNPGNSGGALVNTRGELVGINSAIASNTGSYTGYSFAVPVTIVKKVANDLLNFGEVQRAFMGVSIRDIDAKLAKEKGWKELRGIYVAGLNTSSAAADGGMETGDIIIKINEVPVNSSPQLQEQVSRYRPGDKITATIIRNEKEKVLTIVLKNKNGTTEIVQKEKTSITTLLGANFESLTSDEKLKWKTEGIKIIKLNGGVLRNAGIREGFIITSIDKKPIKATDDLVNALQNKRGGVLIEGLYPNGMRAYYGFGI
jgi:serine protease Do